MTLYSNGDDRHLAAAEIPLVTGTSCDGNDQQADRDRTDKIEENLGERLHRTVNEHVADVLAELSQARAQAIIAAGVEEFPDLFVEAGLDPDNVLQRCFAELFILEALLFGPPYRPGENHTGVIYRGFKQAT